jgi:hypothetical protein
MEVSACEVSTLPPVVSSCARACWGAVGVAAGAQASARANATASVGARASGGLRAGGFGAGFKMR